MNKAFDKIVMFIDEQIKIEESIAKSKNEGHPITHQYGANCMNVVKKFVQEVAEEYNGGWIPVSERLPECENKYGCVSCIVSVIRSHYPTSTYDICDSPYDENIVMHANYNVSQKIWHLESDEQLNALMDIEDTPLNCDYVIAWQPLPEPYTEK